MFCPFFARRINDNGLRITYFSSEIHLVFEDESFLQIAANRLYTFLSRYYNKSVTTYTDRREAGDHMPEKEMLKVSVEEFSRVQKYMLLIQDKESAAYQEIRDRYIELKVILTASGISLTELNKIKE